MESGMNFKCTQCGLCCRNLQNGEIYNFLHNGDGVCKHLDLELNRCEIYENRPIVCNVDLVYELYLKELCSKEEYYKINYEGCRVLKNGKK